MNVVEILKKSEEKKPLDNSPSNDVSMNETIVTDDEQNIDLEDSVFKDFLKEKNWSSENVAEFLEEEKNCQVLGKWDRHIVVLQKTNVAPIVYIIYGTKVNNEGNIKWENIVRLETKNNNNSEYTVGFAENSSINGEPINGGMIDELKKYEGLSEYIAYFNMDNYRKLLNCIGYSKEEIDKNLYIDNYRTYFFGDLTSIGQKKDSLNFFGIRKIIKANEEAYKYDESDKGEHFFVPGINKIQTGEIFLYALYFENMENFKNLDCDSSWYIKDFVKLGNIENEKGEKINCYILQSDDDKRYVIETIKGEKYNKLEELKGSLDKNVDDLKKQYEKKQKEKLEKNLSWEEDLKKILRKAKDKEEIVKWLRGSKFPIIISHPNFVIYSFDADIEKIYMCYKMKNEKNWEIKPLKLSLNNSDCKYRYSLSLNSYKYAEFNYKNLLNLYKKSEKNEYEMIWNAHDYCKLLRKIGYDKGQILKELKTGKNENIDLDYEIYAKKVAYEDNKKKFILSEKDDEQEYKLRLKLHTPNESDVKILSIDVYDEDEEKKETLFVSGFNIDKILNQNEEKPIPVICLINENLEKSYFYIEKFENEDYCDDCKVERADLIKEFFDLELKNALFFGKDTLKEDLIGVLEVAKKYKLSISEVEEILMIKGLEILLKGDRYIIVFKNDEDKKDSNGFMIYGIKDDNEKDKNNIQWKNVVSLETKKDNDKKIHDKYKISYFDDKKNKEFVITNNLIKEITGDEICEYISYFNYLNLKEIIKKFCRSYDKKLLVELQNNLKQNIINLDKHLSENITFGVKKIKKNEGNYTIVEENNRYLFKPELCMLKNNYNALFICGKLAENNNLNINVNSLFNEKKDNYETHHINLVKIKSNMINDLKNKGNDYYILETDGFYDYLICDINGTTYKNLREIEEKFNESVYNLIEAYTKNREEEAGCVLKDKNNFENLLEDEKTSNIDIVELLEERKYHIIANHPNFVIYEFRKDLKEDVPNFYMVYKNKEKDKVNWKLERLKSSDKTLYIELRRKDSNMQKEEYFIDLFKNPEGNNKNKYEVLLFADGYCNLLRGIGYDEKQISKELETTKREDIALDYEIYTKKVAYEDDKKKFILSEKDSKQNYKSNLILHTLEKSNVKLLSVDVYDEDDEKKETLFVSGFILDKTLGQNKGKSFSIINSLNKNLKRSYVYIEQFKNENDFCLKDQDIISDIFNYELCNTLFNRKNKLQEDLKEDALLNLALKKANPSIVEDEIRNILMLKKCQILRYEYRYFIVLKEINKVPTIYVIYRSEGKLGDICRWKDVKKLETKKNKNNVYKASFSDNERFNGTQIKGVLINNFFKQDGSNIYKVCYDYDKIYDLLKAISGSNTTVSEKLECENIYFSENLKSFGLKKIEQIKNGEYRYDKDNVEYTFIPALQDISDYELISGVLSYEKNNKKNNKNGVFLYLRLDKLENVKINDKEPQDYYIFRGEDNYLFVVENIDGKKYKNLQEIEDSYNESLYCLANDSNKKDEKEEVAKELSFEEKLSKLLKEQKTTAKEMTNIEIVDWLKEWNCEVISSDDDFVIYKFGEDVKTGIPNFYMLHRFKNRKIWASKPHKIKVTDRKNFYELGLNNFMDFYGKIHKETIIYIYTSKKFKVLWNIYGYYEFLYGLGYESKHNKLIKQQLEKRLKIVENYKDIKFAYKAHSKMLSDADDRWVMDDKEEYYFKLKLCNFGDINEYILCMDVYKQNGDKVNENTLFVNDFFVENNIPVQIKGEKNKSTKGLLIKITGILKEISKDYDSWFFDSCLCVEKLEKVKDEYIKEATDIEKYLKRTIENALNEQENKVEEIKKEEVTKEEKLKNIVKIMEEMVKKIENIKNTIIENIKTNLASGQTNIVAFETNLEIINGIFKTSLESILTFCESLNEIHKDDLIRRNEELLKEIKSLLDLINKNKTSLKKELLAKSTYNNRKKQIYIDYIYMENKLCDIGVTSTFNVIDIYKYLLHDKMKR